MADPRKKTLLFIDDDEDDYLFLKGAFERCRRDIELHWSQDGEQALDYLAQNSSKPSLIFLDLNMPKLNGREILNQIRKSDEWKHIPVVVLTNSMNKEEALDAYRLGVNSFVRKPSGIKELQEFVNTVAKYWFEYCTLI